MSNSIINSNMFNFIKSTDCNKLIYTLVNRIMLYSMI